MDTLALVLLGAFLFVNTVVAVLNVRNARANYVGARNNEQNAKVNLRMAKANEAIFHDLTERSP